MNDQSSNNMLTAKSFVRAVEAMDGSGVDDFLSANAQQTEWPNLFKPNGDRRGVQQLKEGVEKAKGLLSKQHYEITNEVAAGNSVVLEMVWRGIVDIDIPPLTKGQELVAHCVAVFDFEEGKIVRLRNYDCFDPFAAA